MKTGWSVAAGVLGGFLGAGLIWLVASPPQGEPIALRPPPTPAPLTVHVAGGVIKPGVYALPVESRVADAVQAAGGPLLEADLQTLNLAARLEDGGQVWVPIRPTIDPMGEFSANPGVPTAQNPSPSPVLRVNINTASSEELEALPGIGPATAAKIIEYRQNHGPFVAPEEIQRVSGIGPATFKQIENLIAISDAP